MVAGETCGFDPARAYFSCRDMATCAVTPPAKTSSALLAPSSARTSLAPSRSAQAAGELEGLAFHHEIQVANPEARQHVAHRAAGQKQVQIGLRWRLYARLPPPDSDPALRWLSSM